MREKPLTNADLLHRMAIGFHQAGIDAAWAMRKHDAKSFSMIGPAAVNLALAAELYLKGLHMVLASRPPDTHELWKLFKTLPRLTMIFLEQKYIQVLPTKEDVLKAIHMRIEGKLQSDKRAQSIPTSGNVKALLVSHNHAFTNWRYLHEFTSKGYDYHFDFHAMDVFCEVIQNHLAQLLNDRDSHFGMQNVTTGEDA